MIHVFEVLTLITENQPPERVFSDEPTTIFLLKKRRTVQKISNELSVLAQF